MEHLYKELFLGASENWINLGIMAQWERTLDNSYCLLRSIPGSGKAQSSCISIAVLELMR